MRRIKREIVHRSGVDRDIHWRIIEINDHYVYKSAVFIRTTLRYANRSRKSQWGHQSIFWRWPYVNQHQEYYGTLKLCVAKYRALDRISSLILQVLSPN